MTPHKFHTVLGILLITMFASMFLFQISPSGLLGNSLCETLKNASGGAICDDVPPEMVTLPGNSGEGKIDHTFLQVINVILYLCGTASGVMIIVGGIRYIISVGEEDGMTAAKKTIIWSVLGLLMTILAWAIIINIVRISSAGTSLDNTPSSENVLEVF
ncbi:hypothetical protein HZA38_00440 [Candidatus Peregrinibacteria bacterium]|nr:hypothetical protein [Candidatus Peregrinibacteria bacterium]